MIKIWTIMNEFYSFYASNLTKREKDVNINVRGKQHILKFN